MDVFYLNIEKISQEYDVEFFLNYVDAKKRNKALKYVYKNDKIRTLIGDILVRIILCKRYNYKNEDIKYAYNEYKKPYILNNQDFKFNISHSGDYIVLGVDDRELGIDIEEMKEMEFEGIAKGYFTDLEYKIIMNERVDERLRFFYKFWTLKESYVKYLGEGLHIDLDSFGFKIDPLNNKYELCEKNDNINFTNLDFKNSYQLSLCSEKKNVMIKEITYKDLINLIYNYL